MDKESRREIRIIKNDPDSSRRASARRDGRSPRHSRVQDPLLGQPSTSPPSHSSQGYDRTGSLCDAEMGTARGAAQDTQAAGTSNGGRTGVALWGIARQRVAERRSSLAADLAPSGGPLTADRQRKIIDKVLFRLGSTRSRTTEQSEVPEEQEQTGLFAPLQDGHHLWRMLLSSYLNVLLLAVPTGVISGLLRASPSLVFAANFLALVPLALILGEITEDLALRFGDAIGGLLNATFGNVVEMILGLAALSKGLYRVVAASLIGSILSNLLLVLGCCFLFGGLSHKQQTFNSMANKVASSLLFMACISIIIPSTSKILYGPEVITEGVLTQLSHVIAVLLIGMYICYLYFQLKTHAELMGGEAAHNGGDGGGDEVIHAPALSLSGALATLALITVIVATCSEFLTGAIEAVSESSGVNETFLGLIVLPIAGNSAEHITAVFVAVKDKMDLAIGVSLGSSIQIAIFVLPVTVLAGWAMDRDFTLDFDPFAVLMLTVSVILAYFVSSDGSSNWLLGLQLVLTYVLIGLVYLLEKESKEAPIPGVGGGGGLVGGLRRALLHNA